MGNRRSRNGNVDDAQEGGRRQVLPLCTLYALLVPMASIHGKAMGIFINRNGADFGPYEVEDIRSFLATGRFTAADAGWREGMADWRPLSAFPEFAAGGKRPSRLPATASMPALPDAALGSYARATLQADETAVFQTKMHWIIFVRGAFVAFFCMMVFGWVAAIAGAVTRAGPPALPGGADNASGAAAFFVLLAVLAGALSVASALVVYLTSELVVTDRRVLIKVGFIQRRTLEMFISKIESVSVAQGILARLLNFGTVTLRGTGGSAEPFPRIARPLEFRNCVQRIQSAGERR